MQILAKKQAVLTAPGVPGQKQFASLSPFAASAATAIKMYVTAVQIAEFLIMVVIIMSLPKLVTS